MTLKLACMHQVGKVLWWYLLFLCLLIVVYMWYWTRSWACMWLHCPCCNRIQPLGVICFTFSWIDTVHLGDDRFAVSIWVLGTKQTTWEFSCVCVFLPWGFPEAPGGRLWTAVVCCRLRIALKQPMRVVGAFGRDCYMPVGASVICRICNVVAACVGYMVTCTVLLLCSACSSEIIGRIWST